MCSGVATVREIVPDGSAFSPGYPQTFYPSYLDHDDMLTSSTADSRALLTLNPTSCPKPTIQYNKHPPILSSDAHAVFQGAVSTPSEIPSSRGPLWNMTRPSAMTTTASSPQGIQHTSQFSSRSVTLTVYAETTSASRLYQTASIGASHVPNIPRPSPSAMLNNTVSVSAASYSKFQGSATTTFVYAVIFLQFLLNTRRFNV